MENRRETAREREEIRTRVNREELVERLSRAVTREGSSEPIKGLFLNLHTVPEKALFSVSQPSFCVIAQGCKEVRLGDRRFQYDPYHYLLTSVDLPLAGEVLEASVERPYLSLRLVIDPVLVGSVFVEAGHAIPRYQADVQAIDVSPLDSDLLDAALRLVRLLETPTEAPMLLPLITREIVYRLLTGDQGARLRQIAVLGGQAHRMARAVERLKRDYNRPFRIEDVAGELGMSVSGFHHHFKTVTGMSPLQFQKHLRLQEARRLLLAGTVDAAGAGYQVGYDDASHFSRDYKRFFGEPPVRDVERLRRATQVDSAPHSRVW